VPFATWLYAAIATICMLAVAVSDKLALDIAQSDEGKSFVPRSFSRLVQVAIIGVLAGTGHWFLASVNLVTVLFIWLMIGVIDQRRKDLALLTKPITARP
jgi:hypothetical protein